MLSLSLQIESGVEVKAAAFNRSLTEAIKEAIRIWHKKVAPLHFQAGAARKYGYAKRSKRYQNLKNRKGRPPLVWSGRSKRQLLRAIKPTGSNGLVKGKFITDSRVRYFWQTKAGHPNKGQELVKVTPREEVKMRRSIETLTVKYLDEVRDKKKVG